MIRGAGCTRLPVGALGDDRIPERGELRGIPQPGERRHSLKSCGRGRPSRCSRGRSTRWFISTCSRWSLSWRHRRAGLDVCDFVPGGAGEGQFHPSDRPVGLQGGERRFGVPAITRRVAGTSWRGTIRRTHWRVLDKHGRNRRPGTGGKSSYGIHGTMNWNSIGKMESMGCIRLKADDISWVFDILVDGKSKVLVKD